MDLERLLKEQKPEIAARAADLLARERLRQFVELGEEDSRWRFRRVCEMTATCVRSHSLVPAGAFAEAAARDCFANGIQFYDVEAALQVLEQVIDERILASLPAEEGREAARLTHEVLTSARDAFAVQYLSLGTQ